MKTALQKLYNDIIGNDDILDMPMEFIQKITSKFAKAMDEEKQQIIEAVTHGNRMEFYDATETAGEQYYNEQFN